MQSLHVFLILVEKCSNILRCITVALFHLVNILGVKELLHTVRYVLCCSSTLRLRTFQHWMKSLKATVCLCIFVLHSKTWGVPLMS